MRTATAAFLVSALALAACSSTSSSGFSAASGTQAIPSAVPTAIPPTPAATLAQTATPTSLPTAPPTPAPTTTPAPTAAPSATLGFTPGTSSSPRVVKLTADDTLVFYPNVVPVAEGETVTFEIHNTGNANHEFMLGPAKDALADKEGTPEVQDIGKGETKTLTFTFTGPGPFAFACHEPGHFEVGMLGYVVVIGPDVPAAGTPDSPRLVKVDMTDKLAFEPKEVTVTQGETVMFLLTNEGKATHEFAVGPADRVDADEVDGTIVVEADEITTHRLKTVTYTFDGPGPYGFACHEPGHFEAGMRGTVVLVGP